MWESVNKIIINENKSTMYLTSECSPLLQQCNYFLACDDGNGNDQRAEVRGVRRLACALHLVGEKKSFYQTVSE